MSATLNGHANGHHTLGGIPNVLAAVEGARKMLREADHPNGEVSPAKLRQMAREALAEAVALLDHADERAPVKVERCACGALNRATR